MRNLITTRNVTAALAAMLLAGLALGDAAHAIVETTFRYSTPQTGYFMIPSAAFAPADDSGATFGNDGATMTSPVSTRCFVAPVNLPNGAKMAQIAMWYSNSGSPSLALKLVRESVLDLSQDQIVVMSIVNSSGAPHTTAANITDTSLQSVNNAHYVYFVYQCVKPQETFVAARIKYTYTTAGD
jgi:hypothetical protein